MPGSGQVVIHPTASVDPGAHLGAGVRVGPFAIVETGAWIGEGTLVMGHAVVHGKATLGAQCTVHPHAVVGGDPQDLGYRGGDQRVIIGARVTIREGATVHRATKEGGATRVGDGCLLMANSHVAHDCDVGNGAILANAALLAGHVTVGERAILSGNTAVHQFTRIGKLAMLSGLSGAVKDVGPFLTVSGGRGDIRGLNLIGMKRAGYDEASRRRALLAWKSFFGAPSETEGVALLREMAEGWPVVDEILAFVTAPSRRGIARPEPDHPLVGVRD